MVLLILYWQVICLKPQKTCLRKALFKISCQQNTLHDFVDPEKRSTTTRLTPLVERFHMTKRSTRSYHSEMRYQMIVMAVIGPVSCSTMSGTWHSWLSVCVVAIRWCPDRDRYNVLPACLLAPALSPHVRTATHSPHISDIMEENLQRLFFRNLPTILLRKKLYSPFCWLCCCL